MDTIAHDMGCISSHDQEETLIIRGCTYNPEEIESTTQNSHLALQSGIGATFTVDFKGIEQLVIVQEVKSTYITKLNNSEIIKKICQELHQKHNLGAYVVVLVELGSLPTTNTGKINRDACRTQFLEGSLKVLDDWSLNPQYKKKFIQLQEQIQQLLYTLQTKAC